MIPFDKIFDCLARYRFDSGTEAAFQAGVERALCSGGIAFEREVRLAAGDRIDFMLEGHVGLELKIAGAETAVLRQLARYAESEHVSALILCTTKSAHIGLPRELLGKPLAVYWQGGI
jgi:hypothetical protein